MIRVLKEVDPKLANKLSVARAMIAQSKPLEAAILAPMKIRFGEGLPVPTACTDCDRRIWLAPEFVEGLTEEQLMTLIAHEGYHAAMLDDIRGENRDKALFNIAADFANNAILRLRGYTFEGLDTCDLKTYLSALKNGTPAKGAPFDPALDTHTSTEQLYDMLEAAAQQGGGTPPPDGSGDSGDIQPDQTDDKDGGGDGDGDGDQQGEGNDPPKSKRSASERQRDMKQRLAAGGIAERAKAKHAGSEVDSFTAQFIDDSLTVNEPWQKILSRIVKRSTAREDFSYRKPSRGGMQRGFILPTLFSEKIGEVVIISDTSGSVGRDELSRQAAEIAGIMDRCKPEAIHVAYVDTKVRSTQTFRKGEKVKLEPMGGGGTCFEPGVEWAKTMKPAVCIYFTDGYGDMNFDEPNFPFIWCLTGQHSVKPENVPWGRAIQIDV